MRAIALLTAICTTVPSALSLSTEEASDAHYGQKMFRGGTPSMCHEAGGTPHTMCALLNPLRQGELLHSSARPATTLREDAHRSLMCSRVSPCECACGAAVYVCCRRGTLCVQGASSSAFFASRSFTLVGSSVCSSVCSVSSLCPHRRIASLSLTESDAAGPPAPEYSVPPSCTLRVCVLCSL